jgi:hypothetical protein
MTRYRVHETSEGIAIQVIEVSGNQQELLDAFEECQAGRCSCRTDEYQKVARMEIAATDDEISLYLEARPGTQLDAHEISACLNYTTSKAEESGS